MARARAGAVAGAAAAAGAAATAMAGVASCGGKWQGSAKFRRGLPPGANSWQYCALALRWRCAGAALAPPCSPHAFLSGSA